MAVDSSAWWPGGRTTAKPFWFRNRHRATDRWLSVLQKKLREPNVSCVVVPYFQLPCCHPEGQLYDWAHSHAHRRRGVHLIPNGVTVHLQGAAGRFSSDAVTHLLETMEGFTGDGLTPIPPQGRTAYIFWLIGPETVNQSTGLGVLDELHSKGIKQLILHPEAGPESEALSVT